MSPLAELKRVAPGPSRPVPWPCARDEEIDPKAERKRILQRLHDAAQIRNVDTVQAVFDAHEEIHVDTH